MTNRILVTGHSGFVGKIIAENLIAQNQSVFNLTAGNNKKIDITRPFELNLNSQYDIVVHVAGKAHFIPRNKAEEDVFYDTNYGGTKNLCNALAKLPNKPTSFIFISSVAVYGLDEGELINESYSLKGSTPYARSKILAEDWLKTWAVENGVILTILRLPLIAGPNPPGNLGDMIRAIKRGRYLSIGKANTRKSMVCCIDIADIIPKVAMKGGIYNLTDGYHPTLAEIEHYISSLLNKKRPLCIPYGIAKAIGKLGDIIGERSPINTRKIKKLTSTLTFDDTLAVKVLNWKPTRVLERLPHII